MTGNVRQRPRRQESDGDRLPKAPGPLGETLRRPCGNARAILAVCALVALGATLRYLVASGGGLSEFDPWRHLRLIENLRSGAGFTLFDGQPYLWYNGLWYRLAALIGPAENVKWLSAVLSAVSSAVFFCFLLRTECSLTVAFAGGLLMAAWGPVIAFTTTYGSEAFALLLLALACLLATCQTRRLPTVVAGVLFGAALLSRVNFLFDGFLLAPLIRGWGRRASFLAASAAVVTLGWLHNHDAVRNHPYLFTWDGVATRSADYNPVSTLIPQLHPTAVRATRELYGRTAATPLDVSRQGRTAWNTILFLSLGVCCVLATRRVTLVLAALVPLAYFTILGNAGGTNFFRHYLATFPPLFVGIAVVCGRIRQSARRTGGIASFVWPSLLLGALLTGIPYLRSATPPALEAVTPPPEMLTKERYLVNSGFYHPESLVYRYPAKRFIGMPLDPAEFEEFSRLYPEYTTILWHVPFSVQEDLLRHLTSSGKYRIVDDAPNGAGLRYLVLEKN